jgi:hypothetical protein
VIQRQKGLLVNEKTVMNFEDGATDFWRLNKSLFAANGAEHVTTS